MKTPSFRIACLGEFTMWGRQFVTALQTAQLMEIQFEPAFQRFLDRSGTNGLEIVMLENSPESRQLITKLRQQIDRRFHIVWLGRNFTKEDLIFAIDNRIYMTIENSRPEDPRTVDGLQRLSLNFGYTHQFEEISLSLRAILLQAEGEIPKPVLGEIKAAVTKLDGLGLNNEFNGYNPDAGMKPDGKVPFPKEQGIGEALTTVHNLERTGVLWVRGNIPGEEGKIEFLQGKIVSALAGETHGIKAIYRMFLWDNPRFLFMRRDAKEAIVSGPINQSLKYLCDEGESLKRRYDKVRREIPPPDLMLELEPTALHVGTILDGAEFSTLASVVEFGKVSQILDYNALPDVTLLEGLIKLRRHKLIRVVA
jgi:hypothetical protein